MLEDELLPLKIFFNKIKIKGISVRNFKHALRAKNAFKLKEIKFLAVNIGFKKNISEKFDSNPLNFLYKCCTK